MDQIRRFLFQDLDIRGQYLDLDETWQALNKDRAYPSVVRQLFGEMVALSVMLAGGMKHQGKLTMQIQGDGEISLVLVEVTHDLKVRGMVRTKEAPDLSGDFAALLGQSLIIATLYNAQTDNSFQSIVPRNPNGLIQTFEDYFASSEQLDSKVWIASDKERLNAMLVQKMPEGVTHDTEAWDRIITLSQTITEQELLELEDEVLLHRLFHQESVQLFDPQSVTYECPQDRARFETVIRNLGEQEAKALLDEQGEIAIHNEICNTHVFFNAQDLERIFAQS